jgi:hypothetical protein
LRFFYVQEERYVTVPRMAKSEDVQEERYVTVPRMAKSEDVQEERYVTVPRMTKSDDVQSRHTEFISVSVFCFVKDENLKQVQDDGAFCEFFLSI